MPRVQRPALIRLAAPVNAVRDAAVAELNARVENETTLRTGAEPDAEPGVAQLLRLEADGTGTLVDIERVGRIDIPFFAWFFRPMLAIAQKREAVYTEAALRHALEGAPRRTRAEAGDRPPTGRVQSNPGRPPRDRVARDRNRVVRGPRCSDSSPIRSAAPFARRTRRSALALALTRSACCSRCSPSRSQTVKAGADRS